MNIDLHTHSNASDGQLTPIELLQYAAEKGVQQLALTDHDTVDGLSQLQGYNGPVELIAGVELSCVWGRTLIHVVGLNINPTAEALAVGLSNQHQSRQQRAELIAEKLEKLGFAGAYDGAAAIAGGNHIGRPHFAQFLVEQGYVDTVKQAFKKHLGAGKAGDIKQTWPAVATTVEWIVASGGVAVLAHPLHYKLTATKLRALIGDFKAAGGAAIEVVSGRQPADRTRTLTDLARRFDMLASIGSDFHRPGMPWNELGRLGELPKQCRPVWSAWE